MWCVFAEIVCVARGSQMTMSASLPTAIVPFFGNMPMIFAGVVEVTSTTPAKIMGMFPKKGTIAVGSDADIVIWDPRATHTISAKTHHMRVDYNPYEGRKVKGKPMVVMSRGEVIVEKDKFLGRKGRGRFIKRGSPILQT